MKVLNELRELNRELRALRKDVQIIINHMPKTPDEQAIDDYIDKFIAGDELKIMKLDKAKFFKTEFGTSLEDCILTWDKSLVCGDQQAALWCQAQWEVYQIAIHQFYGVEYHFTRTDEYFGLVTEDEADWLIKCQRT